MSVAIIGLGSAHGDDRVGLAAVQALQRQGVPPHCELHHCSNPATELLPLLGRTHSAILVDAVVDGGAPGRVLHCTPAALAARPPQASSHGISVHGVLAMAAALGLLPPRLQLLGVTISPHTDALAEELSPAVRDALPQLLQQVLAAASMEPQS